MSAEVYRFEISHARAEQAVPRNASPATRPGTYLGRLRTLTVSHTLCSFHFPVKYSVLLGWSFPWSGVYGLSRWAVSTACRNKTPMAEAFLRNKSSHLALNPASECVKTHRDQTRPAGQRTIHPQARVVAELFAETRLSGQSWGNGRSPHWRRCHPCCHPGGLPRGGGRGFSPAGDPRTCRSSKARRTSRSSRPSGPHEQARTACSGSSRHDASHPNN